MALHQEDMPSINSLPSTSFIRTPLADSTGYIGNPASIALYGCQTCPRSKLIQLCSSLSDIFITAIIANQRQGQQRHSVTAITLQRKGTRGVPGGKVMTNNSDNDQQVYCTRVEPEWLDYNGHMNVAYYTRAFDKAGEQFVASVGLSEAQTRETGNSWMVTEAHITYQNEANCADDLKINTRILALDTKRIHLFQSMYRKADSTLLATNEQLILHVNLQQRKVKPFTPEVMQKLQQLWVLNKRLAPLRKRDAPSTSRRAVRLADSRLLLKAKSASTRLNSPDHSCGTCVQYILAKSILFYMFI